jgi:hypothetical protein
LADIDDDGDLDLFVAGANAHLYYFENTGYINEPQFVESELSPKNWTVD